MTAVVSKTPTNFEQSSAGFLGLTVEIIMQQSNARGQDISNTQFEGFRARTGV